MVVQKTDSIQVECKTPEQFKAGKKVSVVAGVLEGLSGTIEGSSAFNRVTISIEASSPGVLFEIDRGAVRLHELR